MNIEHNVPLQAHNTFGIVAKALQLVRVNEVESFQLMLRQPAWQGVPKFVLGGGSNIVLTGDVKPLVLKIELLGKRLVSETDKHWVVEAQAGENWHELVAWSISQGWPGMENLALIPGCVGASPVQNIGAYGVELQDVFDSLDAVDLQTGEAFSLNAGQCAFGYRDSIFKHGPGLAKGGSRSMGLAGRAAIIRVRFKLAKRWRPVLGYADLQKKITETGVAHPTPLQIFDWVCSIRRAKLPDPQIVGNAGSFFKNPSVSAHQCADIIGRDPGVVHYPLPDGSFKLAAAWLIEACGWKGKSVGQAGVFDKQALVLVNRGGLAHPCTGGEVMTLAKSIQTSVYERFGILLEHEPVVV